MFEKNPGLKALLYGALVLFGFGLCWITKPDPVIVYEWKATPLKYPYFELTINGKPYPFPDHIKLPTKDDGKKKKSGEVGVVGPAAALDIPAELVVRNRGGSDGAGIPVSASLETVARKLGVRELDGFTNYSAERPGGQWPEKVTGQIDAYTKGAINLTWAESKDGCWRRFVADEVKQGKIPVLLVCAKLQGYGGNTVAHAVIVTDCEWIMPVGDYVLKYVDCNFPGKQFVAWAAELPNEAQVAILPLPKKADPCPCGDSCACNPCHCHAAKAINYTRFDSEMNAVLVAILDCAISKYEWISEAEFRKAFSSPACHYDDSPTGTITQRGGPQKPELFGVETLVAVLEKFHRSLFGEGNKPGLRDDIANGLKDFNESLQVRLIVIGGCIGGWMLWTGWSLQKLANKA